MSVDEVFEACVSNIKDETFLNKMIESKPFIIADSNTYDNLASSRCLMDFSSDIRIDKASMKKMYEQKLVGGPGRSFYNIIIASPPHGKCPLCGERDATNLDHHLPKAHYASVAITPYNLVPICKDCNFIKLDNKPNSEENVPLNPYYDNIEDDRWLFAEIGVENDKIFYYYEVKCPDWWDETLKRKVHNYFNKLELNKLYSKNALIEINDFIDYLLDIFLTGGVEALQKTLEGIANSCERSRLNSWKTALYSSLSSNRWFLTEGIKYYMD
ncbi:HNH endonuclease [Virgibacillus halodenitrificans]|uniref:HNH endonuclease n=1 Tax=Virgibacillus halodenitrificans TaxID=1482 RepID=UPI00155DB63A